MADLPTRTELFEVGAREVIARSERRAPGKRIAPEAIYTPGSDINILLAGASAMAEDVLRVHVLGLRDLYLDSAEDEGLDRWVLDRTARELIRKAAAPAYVPVTFTRSSGLFGALTLPAHQRLRTRTGVEFELLGAASLPAGSRGPVTATARAVLAGTEANVAPGAITEIVDSPDPALVATNAEPATGGADRELDGAYRERARLWFRAARRGVLPAIELGARSTPGVALATVEEQRDDLGDPTGYVLVYIADVNGRANSTLVSRVQQQLLEYRGAGVPTQVIGAVPEYTPIRYRLRYQAGTDPETAFDQLRAGTVALVNQTPPGKPLEASLLLALARRIPGLLVRDDTLAAPIGDVYPSAPGRALRTTADRVSYVVG